MQAEIKQVGLNWSLGSVLAVLVASSQPSCSSSPGDPGDLSDAGASDQAPTVELLTPSANSSLAGAVSITARASDDLGVAAVEFYADSVLLGTDFAPPYEWSWDTVPVSNGEHLLRVRALDDSGNQATSPDRAVVVFNDLAVPQVNITSPSHGTWVLGVTDIAVEASDDEGVQRVELYVDGVLHQTATSSPYAFRWDATGAAGGSHALIARAYDGSGNVGVDDDTSLSVPDSELPPDPATVAPALDQSVPTSLCKATEFLYTGSAPIQIGVVPGTIECARAAIVRGLVRDLTGHGLPGVTVSIQGHPEFGQTLTRLDGRFDLVVNGGRQLVVSYERAGHLAMHRSPFIGRGGYETVSTVVMRPAEGSATVVDLASAGMKVVRGRAVADAQGTRQPTLLFPAGTTAQMTMPDGSSQALGVLSIRVTEYTEGDDGNHEAVPGSLAPGPAYALELNADEAVAAGATGIQFSQAVPLYVDNYLDLPVGETLPMGYYDSARAVWVGDTNGRVVEILSITAGMVDLDVDGSGTVADPAALAALGISDDERASLASLYAVGQKLWRFSLTHFSSVCCCIGWGPPGDATGMQPAPEKDEEEAEPCEKEGSILEAQNSTLGERVAIVGTGETLNYRSSRVVGDVSQRKLRVSVAGASVPASLKRIVMKISVAGVVSTQIFPATPSQSAAFTWDRRDPYGRTMQGAQQARVSIGYVYDSVYLGAGVFPSAFGVASPTGRIIRTAGSGTLETTVWEQEVINVGKFSSLGVGLGGWTMSGHHVYDALAYSLHAGDGKTLTDEAFDRQITVFAGTGPRGSLGNGGPAIDAGIDARRMTFGPDGALYFTEVCSVRKIDPQGIVTLVAGAACDNTSDRSATDGLPATEATFSHQPLGVAVDMHGNVIISDGEVIRRVGTDGIISKILGTYYNDTYDSQDAAEGTPADEIQTDTIFDVAVGPDGTIYYADYWFAKVRRLNTNGRVYTVAGTGASPWNTGHDFAAEHGKPAVNALLDFPSTVEVAKDGTVYYGDITCLLHRVRPDGILEIFAGDQTEEYACGRSNEPVLANGGAVSDPNGFAFGPSGEIYWSDVNDCVRVVTPDGYIRRVSGDCLAFPGSNEGVPGPALGATFRDSDDIVSGPSGELYISRTFFDNYHILKVEGPLPGYGAVQHAIASPDGNLVHRFDVEGRHLDTRYSYTGAILRRFEYDADNLITAIVDADGNTTSVQRDGGGSPTAIVAPTGNVTPLSRDGNGYLSSISNPAGETFTMAYDDLGRMLSLTDPGTYQSLMSFDDTSGRLLSDDNPAGGSWVIDRVGAVDGYQVAMTSREGRVTSYEVRVPKDSGEKLMLSEGPNGGQTSVLRQADGTTVTVRPDGTTISKSRTTEPRFLMASAIADQVDVQSPGGLTRSLTRSRETVLADPADPLSMSSQVDTITVNGNTSTYTFDRAALTHTFVTAMGRSSTTVIDPEGRSLLRSRPGLEDQHYTYDARGRLATTTRGGGVQAQTYSVGYSSAGFADSVTDPEGRQVVFTHDPAGRITSALLPGSRRVTASYDSVGNVQSLSPPGRPAHTFSYDARGYATRYSAPDVGLGVASTDWIYNLDGQMAQIQYPDGSVTSLSYDARGRTQMIDTPTDTISFAYDPTTGAVASMSTAAVVSSFTRDGPKLLSASVSGPFSGTVTNTYDNDFRVASVSVGSQTAAFSYDADGLLVAAGDLVVSRNAGTGIVETTSIAGLLSDVGSDSFGRVTDYAVAFGATELASFSSTSFDKLNRVLERHESVLGATSEVFTYSYSPEGWLSQVNRDGVMVASYSYDGNGNRTSVTTTSGTVTTTYDDRDRVLAQGGRSYSYDANGAVSSVVDGSEQTDFIYDVAGRLLSVTLPTAVVLSYELDGFGRRVAKYVDGVLVQGFLYKDGRNPVAEFDGAGALVSYFVYGTYSETPDYFVKGGTRYRILRDLMGSPRLVVNVDTGAVAQELAYDSFGRVLVDTNPGFQPFGFAGGLYEAQTGLVTFGARDYEPGTGRFTARDPILFQGGVANLYMYASNDPINRNDPTGLLDLGGLGSIEPMVGAGISASGKLQGNDVQAERSLTDFCPSISVGPFKFSTDNLELSSVDLKFSEFHTSGQIDFKIPFSGSLGGPLGLSGAVGISYWPNGKPSQYVPAPEYNGNNGKPWPEPASNYGDDYNDRMQALDAFRCGPFHSCDQGAGDGSSDDGCSCE